MDCPSRIKISNSGNCSEAFPTSKGCWFCICSNRATLTWAYRGCSFQSWLGSCRQSVRSVRRSSPRNSSFFKKSLYYYKIQTSGWLSTNPMLLSEMSSILMSGPKASHTNLGMYVSFSLARERRPTLESSCVESSSSRYPAIFWLGKINPLSKLLDVPTHQNVS